MKVLRKSLIACAIAATVGTAMASSGSLIQFKPNVMPVVVSVNAKGKVTDILPSRQLPPYLKQLLIKQLDEWIVKPVVVKEHPVDSRFIIEVAMRTKPHHDGKYDTSFVYVKSLPMPFGGAVHWNVIDGGLELALVSDAARFGRGQSMRYVLDFPQNQPAAAGALQSSPAVAPQAASMPTVVAPPQPMSSPAVSAPRTNSETSSGPRH